MELTQMRTTGDTVLVHIPQRQEETVAVGGQKLWFDPSWHVLENKILSGVLVAVPENVGGAYLLTRKGFAGGRVNVDAIAEKLAVGDEVYMDWTVSEDHGKVKLADFELPGVGGVYRATLNQVVARVREGAAGERVLEPFGSYVLCRQVWPDDVQEVDVLGKKLRLRVAVSGLTLGSEEIPPLPFQGEVAHVGLPLRGQPQRVRVGQRVVFDKSQCGRDAHPMKLKLEGQEYLCIRQDYIGAVLEETPTLLSMAVDLGRELVEKPWKALNDAYAGAVDPYANDEVAMVQVTGLGLAALAKSDAHTTCVTYSPGLTDEECDGIVQTFFPGEPAGAWNTAQKVADNPLQFDPAQPMPPVDECFMYPDVVKGYGLDIDIIEKAFASLGEPANFTDLVANHRKGQPLMVGGVDIIALVQQQGGITPNFSEPMMGKYAKNGDLLKVKIPDKPRLMTACCHAGHFNAVAEDGSFAADFCSTCRQAAHLIPYTDLRPEPRQSGRDRI